jgi:hypothetical protein
MCKFLELDFRFGFLRRVSMLIFIVSVTYPNMFLDHLSYQDGTSKRLSCMPILTANRSHQVEPVNICQSHMPELLDL